MFASTSSVILAKKLLQLSHILNKASDFQVIGVRYKDESASEPKPLLSSGYMQKALKAAKNAELSPLETSLERIKNRKITNNDEKAKQDSDLQKKTEEIINCKLKYNYIQKLMQMSGHIILNYDGKNPLSYEDFEEILSIYQKAYLQLFSKDNPSYFKDVLKSLDKSNKDPNMDLDVFPRESEDPELRYKKYVYQAARKNVLKNIAQELSRFKTEKTEQSAQEKEQSQKEQKESAERQPVCPWCNIGKEYTAEDIKNAKETGNILKINRSVTYVPVFILDPLAWERIKEEIRTRSPLERSILFPPLGRILEDFLTEKQIQDYGLTGLTTLRYEVPSVKLCKSCEDKAKDYLRDRKKEVIVWVQESFGDYPKATSLEILHALVGKYLNLRAKRMSHKWALKSIKDLALDKQSYLQARLGSSYVPLQDESDPHTLGQQLNFEAAQLMQIYSNVLDVFESPEDKENLKNSIKEQLTKYMDVLRPLLPARPAVTDTDLPEKESEVPEKMEESPESPKEKSKESEKKSVPETEPASSAEPEETAQEKLEVKPKESKPKEDKKGQLLLF